MEKRQITEEESAERSLMHKVTRSLTNLPSSNAPSDDVFFKWTSSGPWDHYQRETTLGPGRDLAFLKKYPHTIVLIRRVDTPAHGTANLKSTSHRNLVQLHRVYVEEKSIFMVYEMNVASLSDILSSRPHWGHPETAAVCQGMLSALRHLHDNLHISYGDFRLENIRLAWDGTVKLANIGDSLLHARRGYNEDIRSLGPIVKRLSGLPDLKTDSDLSDFLRKLDRGQPASALLQHEFLGHSRGAEQLRRCVWIWLANRGIGC